MQCQFLIFCFQCELVYKTISVTDVNLDDYGSDFESDTSGSDSSCDDGLPVHLLAIAPKLQRKKKFRSRRERVAKTQGSKVSVCN